MLARNDTETLSRLNLDEVAKSIQTFVSQEGEVCAAPSGEAGEACAAPSARSFSCFALLLSAGLTHPWREAALLQLTEMTLRLIPIDSSYLYMPFHFICLSTLTRTCPGN